MIFLNWMVFPRCRQVFPLAVVAMLVGPGLAKPLVAGAGPRGLQRLAKACQWGLLFLAAGAETPPLPNPSPSFAATPPGGSGPALDLGAPDPASRFMALGVHLALERANHTGALPPLDGLEDLLAGNHPGSDFVLATLPATLDSVWPGSAVIPAYTPNRTFRPERPTALLQLPKGAPFNREMARTLRVLPPEALQESFFLLQVMAASFMADALSSPVSHEQNEALARFAKELNILAYRLGASAHARFPHLPQTAFEDLQRQAQATVDRGLRPQAEEVAHVE